MTEATDTLSDLYADPQTCAEMVGLNYIADGSSGFTRIKHGKNFRYTDIESGNAVSAVSKKRITELVIPPAWKDVWIASDGNAHILATGVDEKSRKQYIYHPKWRTTRDLIKFYRMMLFGRSLPKIRKAIDQNLHLRKLSRDKVIATMLWILDNSYIRIGNDAYFTSNDSVGLTTLTDRHVVIAGSVVTLAFKGKSGKQQQITFDNASIAKDLDALREVKGARLFRYQDAASDWHAISSEDINMYLHELTRQQISAKDFRTWGGTLMAYMHLLDDESDKKPEKVIVEAVDQAAAVLGNTRSIARASYVHPHILAMYGSKDFDRYLRHASAARKVAGLDERESQLLHFLEALFEEQFDLLKQNKKPIV